MLKGGDSKESSPFLGSNKLLVTSYQKLSSNESIKINMVDYNE